MQQQISKLTSKYQATIPGSVRNALHLKAGDSITFNVEVNEVRLRKSRAVDFVYLHGIEESLVANCSNETFV